MQRGDGLSASGTGLPNLARWFGLGTQGADAAVVVLEVLSGEHGARRVGDQPFSVSAKPFPSRGEAQAFAVDAITNLVACSNIAISPTKMQVVDCFLTGWGAAFAIADANCLPASREKGSFMASTEERVTYNPCQGFGCHEHCILEVHSKDGKITEGRKRYLNPMLQSR